MLGHLRLLGLEDTVEREPATEEESEAEKKKKHGDTYSEMLHLLGNESLSLTARDGRNDGRKALRALCRKMKTAGNLPVLSAFIFTKDGPSAFIFTNDESTRAIFTKDERRKTSWSTSSKQRAPLLRCVSMARRCGMVCVWL